MNWGIAYCALLVASVAVLNVPSCSMTITAATSIMTVCLDAADDALLQTPTLQLPARETDIVQELEHESDWDLAGHPASYETLLSGLSSSRGWNIPTIVDEPALARQGIRLDYMVVPHPLRAAGVSRHSSLRFVLDVGDLGYYVGDKGLVITTKRVARLRWLSQLPKPGPQALASDSVAERRDATFAAGFWHVDPDAWIEPLAKALNDRDRQVRFDAAYALGELGPQAAKAIDPLIGLLMANDLTLREGAVFALGRIGPKAAKQLLGLIDDPDPDIAIAAAKSIGVMGSAGNEAIPGLIAAGTRHTGSDELYRRIATSIAAIDLGNAIPKLCELLKSNIAGTRAFAAFTIGQMGPLGGQCATELLPLLTDANSEVRFSAAYALARIDLEEDFPTAQLEAAVKDPDEDVSSWAAKALRVINSKKQREQ